MQQHPNNDRKPSAKTRVKVAIRVRPILERQLVGGYKTCVSIKSQQDIMMGYQSLGYNDKNGPRDYKFDRVFSQQSAQNEVYTHCIKDLVLSCFEGYNAAVLAYGQTGSGKTYTMGTAVSTMSDDSRLGIIPRVIGEIYEQIDERSGTSVVTVTASYIQLYNEQIIDLLTEGNFKRNQNIMIKQDRENGLVNVQGVIKEVVASPGEMLRLLQKGGMHRTTKQTNMNDVSSRSHAIFTIYIDSQPISGGKEEKKEEALSGITHSRFFFADLAGSQRAKKTGATGDTLKQGININLGLLQLGNVISALSTIQKHKDQFITFRNSKLTRILQDALGGNSNTYMIACVSPAEFNYEQSVNTLKYASKAMNIKNTPVINRNKNDMIKQENMELKAQNRKLRKILQESGVRLEVQEGVDELAVASKLLREENRTLNRKYNQCLNELKVAKHKLNQLEIRSYEVRRERDLLQLQFEELMRENPKLVQGDTFLAIRQKFQDGQKQKVNMLEKYLQQIQLLQTKLVDKDNLFGQLQMEYNALLQNSKKDQKMLIKKHSMLYQIGRENNRLRREMEKVKQGQGEVLRQSVGEQVGDEVQEVMVQQAASDDQLIKEHEQDYNEKEKQTRDELSEVDRYILEKEQFLQRISKQQITLQTEVISSMKNEYHQKIVQLQKQRKTLLKQKDEGGQVEKSKFMNKIQNLQGELKDYRKKAKEQRNMERQVETQGSRIRDLGQQIKKFKMQKMELHRKLKEDRDHFDKLKNKRVKELLHARKQNMKKQNQIRKIKIKTFKNQLALKRKDEELKRGKKVTQALKLFVKPSGRPNNLVKRQSASMSVQHQLSEKQIKAFDKAQADFVAKICRQIHYQIDRQQQYGRLQAELSESEKELMVFVNDLTGYRIRKERIDIKAEQDELTQQQISQRVSLDVMARDLEDRIQTCESRISQRQESSLFRESIDYFDIEATVLFNKQYESIEALRSFVRALMNSFKTFIFQNCQLLSKQKEDERQIERLKQRVKEQRQRMMNVSAQYYRSRVQMRQQRQNRLYGEESEVSSVGYKKPDERQKKEMQKKFQQLSKSNRQLTSELQKTRRKCEVVQEKYRDIKGMVSKDKSIGRQQDVSFIKQEKKLQKQASNKALLQQLDGMLDNIDRLKKVKSIGALQNVSEEMCGEGQGNINRWQCVWKVDAHSSGVLSMAVHSNFLISTANKSIKIWDIQSHKSIAQLPAPQAVKYVMIDPQRRIFFTACEKSITIWDLISLEVKGVLKCHKDEVKVIHSHGDYLFTGGKGTPSGGSLLVWDLRKLNPNQALQEKQKNQDIFSFTSSSNVLYYGTRNHNIRRMAMNGWDVMAPFDPPHLDSVTGLGMVGGRLVSGSKDKHLRLWSLDNTINNNKHTFHAFNDYVTTVHSANDGAAVFYAGSKDGQVKACYTKNDRIQVLGGILAHTQSVNAISTLDESPYSLMTASQDKAIKLWQPTRQTLDNIGREAYCE